MIHILVAADLAAEQDIVMTAAFDDATPRGTRMLMAVSMIGETSHIHTRRQRARGGVAIRRRVVTAAPMSPVVRA